MKNYTASVPAEIMTALREKGMHIKRYVPQPGVVATNVEFVPPTYAEVFDWFMEKEIYVNIKILKNCYVGEINRIDRIGTYIGGYFSANIIKSWRQVADETILKALKYVDNE